MGNSCYRDENKDRQSSSSQIYPRMRPSSQFDTLDKLNSKNDEEFYQFANLDETNTEAINLRDNDDYKVQPRDFQLMKVLGKGSFGKVMLVEHRNTKKLYAMKVIIKSNIKTEKQMVHTMTERVILEMMDNEFMVKLHYAFQTRHKLYLVVDFMSGGELFYYLRKYIRFDENVVQFYAAEILLALQFMHENKIIYRDLKPENILLDGGGHIKLADFGLSKILDKDQKAFSLCGTPEYLAPEIITSTRTGYTQQCDWWSFGAVIYEMLTGAPPFYSYDRKEIMRKILTYQVPMPDYLSEMSTSLLQGLLQIDPKKRLGFTNDAQEIREHIFFKGINFDKLLNRQLDPPTQFQGGDGFKYFDQNLISGEVKDTPVQAQFNQKFNFSNFSYQQNLMTPRKNSDLYGNYDKISSNYQLVDDTLKEVSGYDSDAGDKDKTKIKNETSENTNTLVIQQDDVNIQCLKE